MDFTSSLYLGLTHPSHSLAAWHRLTTGVPAASEEPRAAKMLAEKLAALIGCERALLMPSTLHLFFDLFRCGLRGGLPIRDRALYPIARWGIEHAAVHGRLQLRMPHLGQGVDPRGLRASVPPGHWPVLVTDGFCPGCGRRAPLRRYADWMKSAGGLVVVDDTQALGLLGVAPSPEHPFGVGGGGSLRQQGLAGASVVVGASLAKAFGVPLAVLAGPARVIDSLAERSETRVHASPVCAPLMAAANAALEQSARHGDRLRSTLARRVAFFRRGLHALGLRAVGGLFPVQSLAQPSAARALQLQQALARRGVKVTVTLPQCSARHALTFVIRADQREAELTHALCVLRASLTPSAVPSHFTPTPRTTA